MPPSPVHCAELACATEPSALCRNSMCHRAQCIVQTCQVIYKSTYVLQAHEVFLSVRVENSKMEKVNTLLLLRLGLLPLLHANQLANARLQFRCWGNHQVLKVTSWKSRLLFTLDFFIQKTLVRGDKNAKDVSTHVEIPEGFILRSVQKLIWLSVLKMVAPYSYFVFDTVLGLSLVQSLVFVFVPNV